MDLRLEKTVRLKGMDISVWADLFNLFGFYYFTYGQQQLVAETSMPTARSPGIPAMDSRTPSMERGRSIWGLGSDSERDAKKSL